MTLLGPWLLQMPVPTLAQQRPHKSPKQAARTIDGKGQKRAMNANDSHDFVILFHPHVWNLTSKTLGSRALQIPHLWMHVRPGMHKAGHCPAQNTFLIVRRSYQILHHQKQRDAKKRYLGRLVYTLSYSMRNLISYTCSVDKTLSTFLLLAFLQQIPRPPGPLPLH